MSKIIKEFFEKMMTITGNKTKEDKFNQLSEKQQKEILKMVNLFSMRRLGSYPMKVIPPPDQGGRELYIGDQHIYGAWQPWYSQESASPKKQLDWFEVEKRLLVGSKDYNNGYFQLAENLPYEEIHQEVGDFLVTSVDDAVSCIPASLGINCGVETRRQLDNSQYTVCSVTRRFVAPPDSYDKKNGDGYSKLYGSGFLVSLPVSTFKPSASKDLKENEEEMIVLFTTHEMIPSAEAISLDKHLWATAELKHGKFNCYRCILRLSSSVLFFTSQKDNWSIVGIKKDSLDDLFYRGVYESDRDEKSDIIPLNLPQMKDLQSIKDKNTWCFIPQYMSLYSVLNEPHFPHLHRVFPHYSHGLANWCAVGPLYDSEVESETKMTGIKTLSSQSQLKHQVNVFPMSSGSPILDLQGNLIGLHQGSLKDDDVGCRNWIDIESILTGLKIQLEK